MTPRVGRSDLSAHPSDDESRPTVATQRTLLLGRRSIQRLMTSAALSDGNPLVKMAATLALFTLVGAAVLFEPRPLQRLGGNGVVQKKS